MNIPSSIKSRLQTDTTNQSLGLKKDRQEKENDLEYDAFYAITRLAILNLKAVAAAESKQDLKFRIYIKDNKLFIEDSHYYDRFRLSQFFFYQNPKELRSLRYYIARALNWFPPETSGDYKTIYKTASQALEHLIKAIDPEEKFTIRGILDDKRLIDQAVEKGINAIEEIQPKLVELKEKKQNKAFLSPTEQRELELYEKLASLWNQRTAQTISNMIQEKQIDSLRTLLNGKLEQFSRIKKSLE